MSDRAFDAAMEALEETQGMQLQLLRKVIGLLLYVGVPLHEIEEILGTVDEIEEDQAKVRARLWLRKETTG